MYKITESHSDLQTQYKYSLLYPPRKGEAREQEDVYDCVSLFGLSHWEMHQHDWLLYSHLAVDGGGGGGGRDMVSHLIMKLPFFSSSDLSESNILSSSTRNNRKYLFRCGFGAAVATSVALVLLLGLGGLVFALAFVLLLGVAPLGLPGLPGALLVEPVLTSADVVGLVVSVRSTPAFEVERMAMTCRAVRTTCKRSDK